jgi:hypothetical protein
LVDWRVDQKLKQRQAEEAKQRQEARQAEILEAARSRIEKARELIPDFVEVTEAVDKIVPDYIAGYMQEAELFAELGYHFAKHPDVLDRLAKLSPEKALVEVGKIESTLTPFGPAGEAATKVNGDKPSVSSNGAEPSQAAQPSDPGTGTLTPSQTRAVAPVIQPLNVGSSSQVEKPVSKMTYDEAKRDWERKHRRDFSRRVRH